MKTALIPSEDIAGFSHWRFDRVGAPAANAMPAEDAREIAEGIAGLLGRLREAVFGDRDSGRLDQLA